MIEWLPRLVARTKASIHAKLLAAFLGIVALMLVSGAIGLNALRDVNHRTADMVQLQRKIAAYRQLNHDTISQLYSVASALLKPEDRRLDATLRQLNQFGYDLDRLQFVAQDEVELLGRVRGDYEEFIRIVTQAIVLIRAGRITEGRDLQLTQATPLADRLERLTNELVNRAEAEMVARVEDNNTAYLHSRYMVVAFALVSIALALGLGYGISVSLVGPVKAMESRMREIAAGDFSNTVEVLNRDELGALASNLNRMSDELGRARLELERRNRDLSESLEQQTATSEILRAISQSPMDLQPVLDAVARNAARICDANDVVIVRTDGNVYRRVAYYAEGTRVLEFSANERVPLRRDFVLSRAIIDKTPVHVEDVLAESDEEYAGGKEYARKLGYRTNLAVPLLGKGNAIGAISMRRDKVAPFSPKQIELLKTFADQATIAIDNTQLFSELQTRTDELARSVAQLRSLSEVGQAVSSTLDLQKVLSAVVTRAVGLSTADGGVVYEYDEASEEFHMRAAYGYSAELVETLRAKPLRFEDGATGRAATTRAPVQIPDLRIEGAYTGPLLSATRQEGVLAVLAVPLLREGRILGSLVVSRKSVGEFSNEIVDLLKTFAAQSTLAIQNARLFREIEQKSRELEAASHHKSEFLANMSHELRTPLNAVIGFSEVLQQKMFGDLNEKQVEYVDDIHSSGRHLLSLINDILNLSKIEAGKVELDSSTFDLANTIEGTLTLVRERATRHGLTMDLSLDDQLGEIEADERKVRQILLNLLSNAVKFTPDGGRIEITGAVVDGAAQIAVSDTGIGIAPEDQASIFEEFQQVGGDHEGKREGTGLGLTLARRFVELHGGRIWVESAAGQGATFTFTLPLSPPKQLTAPHSEPEEIKSEETQQWAAN